MRTVGEPLELAEWRTGQEREVVVGAALSHASFPQPLACSSRLEPGGALDHEAVEQQDRSRAKVSSKGASAQRRAQCACSRQMVCNESNTAQSEELGGGHSAVRAGSSPGGTYVPVRVHTNPPSSAFTQCLGPGAFVLG